jgi:hypothetical protein
MSILSDVMLSIVMLNAIMLCVVQLSLNIPSAVECRNVECHYADTIKLSIVMLSTMLYG